MIRPRGTPPIPSAMSSDSAPVGIASHGHARAGVAHAHHGALAELALDLSQSALEGRLPLGISLAVSRR